MLLPQLNYNKEIIFFSKVTVISKNNFSKFCSRLTWKNNNYSSCNNSKDNSNWSKQQSNSQMLLKLPLSNYLLSNNQQQSKLCLNLTTKLCKVAIIRKPIIAHFVDLDNIFMIVITSTTVQELITTILIPITMDTSAKVNLSAAILPRNIATWFLS